MGAFVRGLTARKDLEVHLISHATSNRDVRDDDGQAADRFAAEFPGTIRVPDFAGPCEAKSYISSLDYLVAGRMHACIAAFSSGTPRSEERRVGKECVSTCRSRWSPFD